MTDLTQDLEAVIEEYEALWNGDFSKRGIIAESASVHEPAAPDGVVHGRDEFEGHLREMYRAFPDLTLDIHEVLVREDLVMIDWTMTGTFEGELYGAPPTGRRMDISGMAKIRVKDGQIREDHIYYDQKKVSDQLGFTFPDVVFLAPKLVWEKVAGGGESRRIPPVDG